MKRDVVDFKYKDVIIHVRKVGSIGDKMEMERIEIEGTIDLRSGKSPKEVLESMGRKTVQLFVDGWSGVMIDGHPAPYSFKALLESFPSEYADMMPELCRFVAASVDILNRKK